MRREECPSPLWAITSHFNPAGYRRRLHNYRMFRRCLKVPLVTVELSFSRDPELAKEDANHLIQLRGRDVMFQKERLLNIARSAVPRGCEAIAWLDCDVIFGAEDWIDQTLGALRRFPLVHLFEEQYNLSPDFRTGDPLNSNQSHAAPSVVCAVAEWESSPPASREDSPPAKDVAWGFAWAARRELLDAHGLYDTCIVGGGDSAIYWAAVGTFERAREAMRMNERRYKHYLDWARPFYAAVRGRVGWIRAPIFHLWHGDTLNRRYGARHRGREIFEFDPAEDIRVDQQGCWRWSSDKPGLHAYVENYFRSRGEDGEVSSENLTVG